MTIHVTIGEAEKRLAELVEAALRGEEVVLAIGSGPEVRLTPVPAPAAPKRSREEIAESRRKALGMWKGVLTPAQAEVPPSMTDEEWDERWHRKFGPAA